MNNIKLPDKPSELIRIALKDLEAIEKDSRYKVTMYCYHSPSGYDNVCHVCFAGAVMAQTLQCPIDLEIDPCELDNDLCSKLHALDSFRSGYLEMGFNELKLPMPPDWPQYIEIVSYKDDKLLFKEQMSDLATRLESVGY